MKTLIMLMYSSFSQLCHILTSKLAGTPETPTWAEGVRMSCGASYRKVHKWKKKKPTTAYDPKLWGTKQLLLKKRACAPYRSLCCEKKRDVDALKRFLHSFVHAHICLHLWDACVLLWQHSWSLVPFFVRGPGFNRSGLSHINTVRRKDHCTALYTPVGPSFSQLVENKNNQSARDNKRKFSLRRKD